MPMAYSPPYDKAIDAIKWRLAILEGEFISAPNWRRDYMGWDRVSVRDLDTLVPMVNAFFINCDSPYRVYHSMGEIRPATTKIMEKYNGER